MEDLEKLRSTFAWKSIGFERAKPEPCNNSFEYSDADLVKLDSSKFKGDFQTSFSFRKCNLADSKVRWSELNYVKFEGCRAVGSSFSQVELSFGEGIADSYSEKCTFKNVGISNMCMAGSAVVKAKADKCRNSHFRMTGCEVNGSKLNDFSFSYVVIENSKIDDLKWENVLTQLMLSQGNKYSDLDISKGRIKTSKFIDDTFEKVKFADIKFVECYFRNIDFGDVVFENCTFKDCLFEECRYSEEQGKMFEGA